MNILEVAGTILQTVPDMLDIDQGVVVDKGTTRERIGLDEVARIAYFRPDTLPADFQAELLATRHYVPRQYPFAFTNGIQASWLEVDTETGFITLLNHWCVEDCGTIINPQLVDEQIRGGVVHGIGNALFERMIYDENGQPQTTNYGEYLLPLATEMPRIEIVHMESPSPRNPIGVKGAGEGGTIPAAACVISAIEDALSPFHVRLGSHPLSPQDLVELIDRG